MVPDRIVAVGLLTQANLETLGPTFERAWPVEDTPSFEELLTAIDRAETEPGGLAEQKGNVDGPNVR